jgi:hypothetical protein
MSIDTTRRDWIATGLTALSLGTIPANGQEPSSLTSVPKRATAPKRKLALLTTTYHYLSHAYHIGGRFLDGLIDENGQHKFLDCGIASWHVAALGPKDLSRELAKKHGILQAKSIAEALTLGTGQLAVDGALLIGEHGDYPYNARGQKLYPRYEMFQAICDVFKASKRTVPVFNDKHLSYDRKLAANMVATRDVPQT